MKNIFLIAALFLTGSLQAQSIKRSVIASAGNTSVAGNIILRQTVGETLTMKYSSGNSIIRQGFQQSGISVARIMNDEVVTEEAVTEPSAERTESIVDVSNFSVNVYPNPATDYVNISVMELPASKCMYFLYDITGKLLEVQDLVTTETKLEFQNLAEGRYILSVKSQDGKINESFKLVKQ